MNRTSSAKRGLALGWLREPTLHFFVIGACLFALHHWFVGDPRTITVTDAIKAHVARRFTDQYGRAPSDAELSRAMRGWQEEEALYREALRDGLDREDATIRSVLADKVRARAALEVPRREPSQAELEKWLDEHRSLYELPLRYDYEAVTFAKTRPAEQELASYQQALTAGRNPTELGRPIAGGSLSAAELSAKFGAEFAASAPQPPWGRWQRVDAGAEWLLARVTGVQGGLPSVDELRPQLLTDWSRAEEKRAVDRALAQIVARYRFEERP